MTNPMESETLVMTHVFEDKMTHAFYSITLVGPFLRTVREAQEKIAEYAKIPAVRLQGHHHVEPGNVVALSVKHVVRSTVLP